MRLCHRKYFDSLPQIFFHFFSKFFFFNFFFSNVPNEHGRSFLTFHTSLFLHSPQLVSFYAVISFQIGLSILNRFEILRDIKSNVIKKSHNVSPSFQIFFPILSLLPIKPFISNRFSTHIFPCYVCTGHISRLSRCSHSLINSSFRCCFDSLII